MRRHTGPSEGTARRWVLPVLVAAPVFGVLDALWIGLVARDLYEAELGERLAEPLVGWAAGVFYVVYLVGVTVLVIRPSLDADSARMALGRGTLLGLTAYATFGFTNLATLDGWPAVLSVSDTLWGAVLTATTAVTTFLVCRRVSPRRASPR